MKNNSFIFSIIMPIYNTEEFLKEAIDSIINQDIGFKKNVQLILVNDGSTDNSERICKKYQEQYRDNIIYVKKENGGSASARNAGIKYCQGKYVNFFDSDDILVPNVLSEVEKFYKINHNFVDMVTIPLVFFGAQEGLHAHYIYMGKNNRVIDLMKEPYNFILSSAASFYKREMLDELKFDENLKICEDILFNFSVYKKNTKFGYVCENDVKYMYRKRMESNSQADSFKKNSRNFDATLKIINSFDLNDLKDYEIELIIYELRHVLKEINSKIYKSKKEYECIIEKFKKIINLLPINYVLYYSKWASSYNFKQVYFLLTNRKWEKSICNDSLPVDINIKFKDYSIKHGKFIVELLFNNYGYDSLDVVAFDGNNKIYEPTISKDFNSSYDEYYGEFFLDKTHYRKFEFNLNGKVLRFMLYDRKKNKYYPASSLKDSVRNKLYLHDMNLGLRYKDKIVRFSGYKFKIDKCNVSQIKYLLSTIKSLKKTTGKFFLYRLFARRKKQYILIGDRPEKAGDNAEALFKYICKERKDLKEKTYFVISKKSSDYNKLKKIGKVVNISGFKHKILFLNAKYIYSSHNHRLFYNAFDLDKLRYYSDLFNYEFIWLQHGITQNNIARAANRLNTKADYIVSATNDEYNEFIQDKYFYENNKIILTGFARYDFLYDDSKNIISICPTWRRNLVGPILATGINAPLDGFEQTDYYNNYKNLLTNKKLNKLLKDNNLVLKFILHPGMSCYLDLFKQFENENIKMISQSEVVYNKVFEESKLLITDYSSVAFDFAYLNKPIIYYQYDKDDFHNVQYRKGYFSYENDGFGDVLTNYNDVIDKIDYFIKNDFKNEEKYVDRINKTFKYHDKNNSKRIIDITYK